MAMFVTTRVRQLLLLAAALVTIGCDRVTKHVATTMLAGEPDRSFWADTVRLGYAENAGGFLSLGADWPALARTVVFTVLTGALLVAAAYVGRRRTDSATLLGLTLFVAGGASNWLDRVAHGRVVDFLNIGIGALRTGVFNVADVAIMIGAGLLLFAELRRMRETSLP
jgi:signal peptidase II